VRESATDAELLAAARGGDAGAAGALLERHRAGMNAVAYGVLGWRSEADDVVQDAMIVALGGLDQVRQPAAVGSWLRAVTRNLARMHVRREQRVTVTSPGDLPFPTSAVSRGPEELLEDHLLRDWVWAALERLTEPLRTVVMLRYFSGVRTYDEIAAVCELPIGTVRSRLHQARRLMLDALAETSDEFLPDAHRLLARRTAEAGELIEAGPRGRFASVLREAATAELTLIGPQGQRGRGQDTLVSIMESDVSAGVGQRLRHVVASKDLTILECDLISPPSDPTHCPPGVLWLMRLDQDRITSIRLFHPPRPIGASS
jgi:RNA polymerase sigma-70 factor (ECF subfamily)